MLNHHLCMVAQRGHLSCFSLPRPHRVKPPVNHVRVCALMCVLPVAVAVCWCHWDPGRTTPPVLRRTEPSRGRTASACCSWTLPERWTSPCCPTHLDKDTNDASSDYWHHRAANSSSFSWWGDRWLNKTREEHFHTSLLPSLTFVDARLLCTAKPCPLHHLWFNVICGCLLSWQLFQMSKLLRAPA